MNEQTYPWYMVNKDGMCTLCADQADAEKEAKDAQEVWPHMGPHRAVQLRESAGAWFTAADMATAAARGFREGQASQAAVAAGWMMVPVEPTPERISAMMTSQARDDEGEFPMLMDLIDFSGENKNRAACAAAYRAAVSSPAPSTEGESNE